MKKVLSLTVLIIEISACSAENKPIPTSVCELTKSPQNFSGKIIEINSYVDSDGFEWILLKDENCNTRGVNLVYSEVGKKSTNANKIDTAVFRTPPWGTDYKDIHATFVGRFQWRPESEDLHYKMQVVVDRVYNLKIGSLKQKRQSPFPELR